MVLHANIAGWTGWRRYGPAAGSGFVHIIAAAGIISMIAASANQQLPPPPKPDPPRQLEVTLISEAPIPPSMGMRPAPPEARKPSAPAARDAAPLAPAPKSADSKTPKQKPSAGAPASPGAAVTNDPGGVYLGDASGSSGVPLGLRSIYEGADPCDQKNIALGRDCGVKWSQKLGEGSLLQKPTARELQAMYPGIVLPCQWKVGCDQKEWKSNNGTRSVFNPNGAAMMSGAGGLGGINGLTGRLGFNPDFTDPGFGD
jgi:hypothetical protein